MHARRDALPAEEHHADECGLEKKGEEDLVGKQGARDIPDRLHIARPVGAELEAHRHAGDHAQREGEGDNLHPEGIGLGPARLAAVVRAQPEVEDQPRQPDRDRWEQDVERHVGGELQARQEQCIGGSGHDVILCKAWRSTSALWARERRSSSDIAGWRMRLTPSRPTTLGKDRVTP